MSKSQYRVEEGLQPVQDKEWAAAARLQKEEDLFCGDLHGRSDKKKGGASYKIKQPQHARSVLPLSRIQDRKYTSLLDDRLPAETLNQLLGTLNHEPVKSLACILYLIVQHLCYDHLNCNCIIYK
jgi:hypothetical protein